MAARDVQIRITATDSASAAFRQVSEASARTAASMQDLSRSASGFVFNSASFAVGMAGFQGLTSSIEMAKNAIFDFSKSLETQEIGIAGILTSMTTLNGRNLQWNEALGFSKTIMRQLNDEALRTAATSEELITTFRGILGPALNAKMTIDQIIQLTSTGVNAVKSLGLNGTQLVQELRDLVQGGIQPASSTLATALGLKDEDIKKAKESSEGLFNFLMDRLSGFKIASEYTQNTFQGKMDQIKEGFTRIGSEGTIPIFDAMKEQLGKIADYLIIVDANTKQISLNPQLINDLTYISNEALKIGGGLKDAFGPALDVAIPALRLAGEAIAYVGENAKAVGVALTTWYVLTNINAMYRDVVAITAGATSANTLLGEAVLNVRTRYMELIAAAESSAVVQEAAFKAASAGAYELSNQILYVNDELIALGVSATRAGEIQVQAARAAMTGQLELAASIIETARAHAVAGAAAVESSNVTIASSARAEAAVYSLRGAVLALAGGWIGVAAAIAYASYQLAVYLQNKNRVDSYNKHAEVYEFNGQYYKKQFSNEAGVDELGNPVAGYTTVPLSAAELEAHNYYLQNGVAPPWEGGPPAINTSFNPPDIAGLAAKYGTAPTTGSTHKGADPAKAAERAYEEQQRLKDKIADMIAKMNEKIMDETGNVFDTSRLKLKDEIANMSRELDKMKIDLSKYGMGKEADAARAKMVEYEKIQAAKIERVWKEAYTDMRNNTALIGTQIINDRQKQAEAEYQIELAKIDKETRERQKQVGRTYATTLSDAAFKKLKPEDQQKYLEAKRKEADLNRQISDEDAAKRAFAQQKRDKAIRDADLQAFGYDVELNNLKIQLEGKTQVEIDKLNETTLRSKINRLDVEIEKSKNNKEEVVKLEKEKADAIEQLRQSAGRNMATAAVEGVRRMKEATIDYAKFFTDVWDDINQSAEDHWTKMMKRQESFGSGFKGIVTDMANYVISMYIKMLYYQMIMTPLQNFVGNMFSGMFGATDTRIAVPVVSSVGSSLVNNSMSHGVVVEQKLATGGRYAGGLALVGEQGPELIHFGEAGYVTNARSTADLLGKSSQTLDSVKVNIINKTENQVEATSAQATFNGKDVIIDVVVEALQTNRGGLQTLVRGMAINYG